jgi:hypothetical protein
VASRAETSQSCGSFAMMMKPRQVHSDGNQSVDERLQHTKGIIVIFFAFCNRKGKEQRHSNPQSADNKLEFQEECILIHRILLQLN